MSVLEFLWWRLNTAMGRTNSDTWWRVLLTARGYGTGNFACGCLAPHGIHIRVSEDGSDVTQDYYINGA